MGVNEEWKKSPELSALILSALFQGEEITHFTHEYDEGLDRDFALFVLHSGPTRGRSDLQRGHDDKVEHKQYAVTRIPEAYLRLSMSWPSWIFTPKWGSKPSSWSARETSGCNSIRICRLVYPLIIPSLAPRDVR